ncbi:cyclase family protein [Aliarcobacter butzleri]|uniref:cyclase family protein n=1 Tax=Aliarcobacter butzleri TaxID=28197 RepID=UPI00344E8324
MSKKLYLSYLLEENTPTYGNRNRFFIEKKSDITKGDVANDSSISTTLHIGTHIDMPYHFYENGQTIENFEADFWFFEKVLFIELEPKELIIKNDLIKKLQLIEDIGYEILIVKTGICYKRNKDEFWEKNYGFDPCIYNFLIKYFPSIRIFGFDSISVSSFAYRLIGRETHKKFLNPEKPILLLEDMDLTQVNKNKGLNKIIISPLRISKCDGLPCTVIGWIND